MSRQSWEYWKGIEDTVIKAAQTAPEASTAKENSFDYRWAQAQKVVTGSGQIATPEAIEAVFLSTNA